MELLATTGDAFVRVGAHTRLEGSGAQCLAVARDTVYVGCRGSGLKRSADGGDTFEDVPLPEQDVFSVAVSAADGAVYAGTEPSRLFRSADGGHSWDRADAGRDRRYAWALAVDPADPDRWFVSAAPGPFEAHGSRPSNSVIFRWEGSGPWQAIAGPLDSHVYALATGDGKLFAGLGDGTLLESDDGGESWTDLGERIAGVTALVAT